MFEEVKKMFISFWKKTNGFKTIIGIVLHIAWAYIHISNDFDLTTALEGHGIIATITGVGLGHKILKFTKTESGKKTINLIIGLLSKK